MRNPLTGLIRKRSRRRTTRKRRSSCASTPNERAASKTILEHVLLFANISVLFAALVHRVVFLCDFQSARNFAQRSRVSFNIASHLVRVESSISDVQLSEEMRVIFSKPLINIRIDDFINDDQSEYWTRFKKHELLDLLNRLDLLETVRVSAFDRTCAFNREELLTHMLTKLAYGLPHTVMADMIFGGDSCRWGRGCNCLVKHVDDKFIELININSLQTWTPYFAQFNEAICRKFSYY